MDLEWVLLDEGSGIWHAFRVDETETVCGLEIEPFDPDHWARRIGTRRPCDNCTKIIANASDVEGVPV